MFWIYLLHFEMYLVLDLSLATEIEKKTSRQHNKKLSKTFHLGFLFVHFKKIERKN